MPKLLDLYSGAGGAAVGYYRAGFTDITGVDNRPQKNYPYKFVQADALEYIAKHGHEFDLIHASPPCQVHSVTASLSRITHLDLVPQTRAALIATGKPYIIENVPGAPLINPLMLCGTMFGLGVIRHRLFECSPVVWFPPSNCKHEGTCEPMFWADKKRSTKFHKFVIVAGKNFKKRTAEIAMQIDWMICAELSQAIPPAYTFWLGIEMLRLLSPPSGLAAQRTP